MFGPRKILLGSKICSQDLSSKVCGWAKTHRSWVALNLLMFIVVSPWDAHFTPSPHKTTSDAINHLLTVSHRRATYASQLVAACLN